MITVGRGGRPNVDEVLERQLDESLGGGNSDRSGRGDDCGRVREVRGVERWWEDTRGDGDGWCGGRRVAG